MAFMDELKARVKPAQKVIVLPENDSDRALKAAAIVTKEGFAKIVLVGDPAKLQKDAERLGISFDGVKIVNPATYEKMDELCAYFAERRKKKGMTVEKAREYNRDKIDEGRCTVLTGDVSSLDLPKETFDLAMAFETIYFWPGLDRCFAQVAGILKQGGYFMICNESDGADAFSLKYEKIIDGMKVYTASEIEAALKKAGFSEIRVNHHYSRPWIAILAKK